MKARTKADILFDYIVSGDSMEKIANNNDINTGEVSALLRAYGFNYNFQGKYQSGQHRGFYKNGYTINFTYNNKKYSYTHKIKLNDIIEFVEKYGWATKDDPCDNDEFESFLDEYLEDVAEEAVNQKIREQEQLELEAKQAEKERQRQAKEAQRIAQEAEKERRRQAEEAQRIAIEKQIHENDKRSHEIEEQIRKLEEENRRAEEELRKIEEELRKIEEKKKNEQFTGLYNEGVKLYKAKKLNEALAKFREAEKIKTTNELNAHIAYTLASASNSDDFAEEINKRIRKVLTLTKDNQSSKDKYIYAKSELALGRKGSACGGFFQAGHIAYEKGDYALADKYYTEGFEACGYYDRIHESTKKTPFRMAYARGKKENLTTDDYNYIVKWYKEAIEKSLEVGLSYGNMAQAYLQLKQYEEACEAAENALKNGNEQQYVFNHLINANWELKDYNGVIAACNKAKTAGCKINYFKLGYSLSETGDDDSAISAYKECIRLDDDTASRWNLAMIYFRKKQYSEAIKYAEAAMQKFNQDYREHYGELVLKIAALANDEAARDRMLQYLPKERERLEQKRLEQKRLEQERLEQKRLEQERLEQKRLEQERLEQKRLEQERLEQERLEQKRLEQERLEQEHLEQERLEQELLKQEKRAAIKRRNNDEFILLF